MNNFDELIGMGGSVKRAPEKLTDEKNPLTELAQEALSKKEAYSPPIQSKKTNQIIFNN